MEFPPHAAWLDFRSPEDDEAFRVLRVLREPRAAQAGCWQRRWVVLYQGMLTLFQDESCTRSTARLALPSAARALAFQDPRAPTRTALRLARPHGFLVDLNPLDAEDPSLPSGEFRQLLMFEAADAEDLKVWLDVLRPRMDASRVPAPVLPKERLGRCTVGCAPACRGRSPLSARVQHSEARHVHHLSRPASSTSTISVTTKMIRLGL